MAIIKLAKNITIKVKDDYLVKAGKFIELSDMINLTAKRRDLVLATNKKIKIHGSKH